MSFDLTEKQHELLKVWKAEQDAIVTAQQREHNEKIDADPGLTPDEKEFNKMLEPLPYYGATGGVYTYCFTPTSIGTILRVTHSMNETEIDLTEYDMW